MADTTLRFQAQPGLGSITLHLIGIGGAGTPAASYIASEQTNSGWYETTVPQSLVGLFIYWGTYAGQTIVNGLFDLLDDTNQYFGYDPSASFSATGAAGGSDPAAALAAVGLTASRAGNLDNLDVTVSSREAEVDASSRATTNQTEHDATQSTLAAIDVSSQVETALTNQGYTTGRAGGLDHLDADISTRATAGAVQSLQTSNNTLHSNTQQLINNRPTTADIAARVWDEATNDIVAAGSIGQLIKSNLDAAVSTLFTSTAGTALSNLVSSEHTSTRSDIAGVSATVSNADMDTIAGKVWGVVLASPSAGSIGEILVTNLDTPVSTRQSETSAASRATTNQNEHDQTQTAIATITTLTQADVQSAMTAQGYTTQRAGNLNNLNAPVSSRQSESDAAARAATNQTEHDATQLALANLDVSGSVAAALTSQGFTAARAAKLDAIGAWPTVALIVSGVLDAALSSHTNTGSVGAGIALSRDQATIAARNTQS